MKGIRGQRLAYLEVIQKTSACANTKKRTIKDGPRNHLFSECLCREEDRSGMFGPIPKGVGRTKGDRNVLTGPRVNITKIRRVNQERD